MNPIYGVVSPQKTKETGSSRPLKRLRKRNSDDKAPKVSPPLKRWKKQRANRDTVESDSEDVEAAAKEGDQESLILKEPIMIESLPSTQPEFAEATASTPPLSPIQAEETAQDRVSTPSVSPIIEQVHTDAPDIPTTPLLNLDDEDQILGEDQNLDVDQNLEDDFKTSIASHIIILSEEADSAGSVSSDPANADTTSEAATNENADAVGPSGHAPLPAVNKADLIKKFVRGDAPVPWSETPRGQEWIKEWNKVDFVPTANILAEHLAKADEMLMNDDFKAQLRVTALSTWHLQGQHSITQAKVNKIQETLIQQDMNVKLEKNRFLSHPLTALGIAWEISVSFPFQLDSTSWWSRINKFLLGERGNELYVSESWISSELGVANQAAQQDQLNEIQNSVELLVSLLLPDDARKGEKVTKSKFKIDQPLKGKDDDNEDQGNSERGRGHGQGKGFSSREAGTSTQRSNSDADRRKSFDKQVLTKPDILIQGESQESQKFMQTLKLKGKETSVYYQDPKLQKLDEEISKILFLKGNPGMDFESLKEEEARLKAENVKSKSKASITAKKPPKPKGIMIKEKTNSKATKIESKAKSQVEVDPRFKGKARVYEPVKVYMPIMDLEAKSNTVNSDITMNGFEARVIRGKEARDKSGLCSSKEKRINNTTSDPTSLSEPGVGTTPERLNQPESIQMVYHSVLKEDIMLYFMTNGRVFQIRKNAIRLEYFEELQHVLFLLQVKNISTYGAASYLKSDIQRQKKLYSVKSDRPYYPKYRAHNGDIVEMKPNTAKIPTFLGIKGLEFNLESDKAYVIRLDQDIRKAKINDLRAAIFQTCEDTVELKDAKSRMQNELEYAERSLLKNYLRTTPDIKEITH
ncbi:hypothetical protein AgCh_016755 [Apium graveolens]